MTDLILSLPGDIPGLLRRGSPVLHPRVPGVPCAIIGCHTNDRTARVSYPWTIDGLDGDSWALADLALDLTDPTGRAHAAWWARSRLRTRPDNSAWDVMGCGVFGADMTPEQIDTLARLVLRLAGRSHA